jgi:hypothetical protein
MSTGDSNKVSLDELAEGRLPKRICKAINDMEIRVGEMLEWDASKKPNKLEVSREEVRLDIHLRIPTKHFLLILVGAGGVTAIVRWVSMLLIT